MTTLIRGTQRLGLILENGTKLMTYSSRLMSNAVRNRVVDGINGEKIITSPFPDCDFPMMPVHEYVWQNVEKFPNKVALECGVTGRSYTYAKVRDAANYVARSLLDIGLRNGDVIAVILPNMPESAIAFLGSLEAGLVVTTVNPHYTVDEISKQIKSSGAKAVITAGEVASTVLQAAKASLPSTAPFIVVDDATIPVPPGTIPFKDLITRGKSLPPVPSKPWIPDDLAALPYSSGTTGMPKGVMLTHRNLVSNMVQVENSVADRAWQQTTETFQEVVPTVLPLFHIYGMNGIMLPKLWLGAKLITLPSFTPKTFVDVLDKHKATLLYCVPPIVLFLAASPLVKKEHLQYARNAISGAAPLGKADVDRFYSKFDSNDSKVQFYQGYGLTETSPVTFLQRPDTGKYASIGSPVANCESRLVDPVTNKDILTPGQTGEIWVRGVHVMKGYYNNENATKEILQPDGWLKTGDLAYFDEDYDFFITDRLKELIKVKGFQVPPAELEELLRTHPDVAEAAVIGVPDSRSGEVPRAFVLLKNGKQPTEEDIKNFVKGKVSEYKQLAGGVTFVDEIPKNPSGKILRRQLKIKYVE